jgi:hypothetical protein
MTYVLVNPSNATLPFLAIWPGHGSDVHIVPNLDAQLRQLMSIDWIPSQGLVATNSTHILRISPETGSFEAIMPLSDHDLQNGGHTTTDGTHLYVHLHDGEEYWIGTVNFSATPASISLSVRTSTFTGRCLSALRALASADKNGVCRVWARRQWNGFGHGFAPTQVVQPSQQRGPHAPELVTHRKSRGFCRGEKLGLRVGERLGKRVDLN